MGEAVWPPKPPEAQWHGLYRHWPNVKTQLLNMVWVAGRLLRQRDNQFKIGIP